VAVWNVQKANETGDVNQGNVERERPVDFAFLHMTDARLYPIRDAFNHFLRCASNSFCQSLMMQRSFNVGIIDKTSSQHS
jgi:hypothetical protein